MNGWVDGWEDGWEDGWMDGWIGHSFPNKANGVQENLHLNSPHIFLVLLLA